MAFVTVPGSNGTWEYENSPESYKFEEGEFDRNANYSIIYAYNLHFPIGTVVFDHQLHTQFLCCDQTLEFPTILKSKHIKKLIK